MIVHAVWPQDSSVKDLYAWDGSAGVLEGKVVRDAHAAAGSLLAVPIFYQEQVVGALRALEYFLSASEFLIFFSHASLMVLTTFSGVPFATQMPK